MALGHGEQIGYSNLVESLLGHSLDKGARFTDWSRRPLDKRQIDYAIADVTHLADGLPADGREARKKPGAAPGSTRRWSGSPTRRASPYRPEDAWKRLKLPSRNPAVLGRLKALAAWRETEARAKNLPRGRIIKDETLTEIVLHPPKTQDDLGQGPRPVGGLEDQRHRRAADGGDRRGQAARARRNARPRTEAARPDQGRRAGQRPAQAAAQDPRQGDRRRGAADRPVATTSRRSPPACARTSTSCRAGATSSSARMRSTWSKAGSRFAIENGKLKMSRVAEQRRPSMRKTRCFWPLPCSSPAATAPAQPIVHGETPGHTCDDRRH